MAGRPAVAPAAVPTTSTARAPTTPAPGEHRHLSLSLPQTRLCTRPMLVLRMGHLSQTDALRRVIHTHAVLVCLRPAAKCHTVVTQHQHRGWSPHSSPLPHAASATAPKPNHTISTCTSTSSGALAAASCSNTRPWALTTAAPGPGTCPAAAGAATAAFGRHAGTGAVCPTACLAAPTHCTCPATCRPRLPSP